MVKAEKEQFFVLREQMPGKKPTFKTFKNLSSVIAAKQRALKYVAMTGKTAEFKCFDW